VRTFIVMILLAPSLCWAQTSDRKDYIIFAVEAQRDEFLSKEAICRADWAVQVDKLKKEIEELKAKLEKPDAK
jgi:uncharacterized membrane protein YukC